MKTSDLSTDKARQVFWSVFVATFLLKSVLAASFPITGDEAFFYQWGIFTAWGYSDHPPMIGWIFAVLHRLGDSPLILLSFKIMVNSVIAVGLVDILMRHLNPERETVAWIAGAVYLVMPWSWMFILVTTDSPLVLFGALSAWCYLRANEEKDARLVWYVLAGLFVGLAFLSKYFAVLLGLAYAVHILGWRRERWWAIFVMFAMALPSICINLLFNATHGWPNIMFNVYNRNKDAHLNATTFLVFLGMTVYLLTPWLLWSALKARKRYGQSASIQAAAGVLWLVPMGVFAMVSLSRTIGLHWVLCFVPLFVYWVGLRVDPLPLKRSLYWTIVLSVPHFLLVAAFIWAPMSVWQKTKLYDRVIFTHKTPALVAALQADMPKDALLMARAYNPAAMLAFSHGKYVPVFGVGRHHARQDDLIVDFRAMQGKTMRIFDYNEPDLADFTPYFEQVGRKKIVIEGVAFYAVDGTGFKYQVFRDKVLTTIAEEFHDVPAWLPNYGSPFCERYGFKQCVRAANEH